MRNSYCLLYKSSRLIDRGMRWNAAEYYENIRDTSAQEYATWSLNGILTRRPIFLDVLTEQHIDPVCTLEEQIVCLWRRNTQTLPPSSTNSTQWRARQLRAVL